MVNGTGAVIVCAFALYRKRSVGPYQRLDGCGKLRLERGGELGETLPEASL
jgi:hypothetical protein